MMKIKVVIEPSDEGWYSVTVPSLPGCISEGKTKEEAVKNIKEAVQFYETVLGMVGESFGEGRIALKFGGQKINLHEQGNEFEPHVVALCHFSCGHFFCNPVAAAVHARGGAFSRDRLRG